MMQALLASLQAQILGKPDYAYNETAITVQSALLPKVWILTCTTSTQNC